MRRKNYADMFDAICDGSPIVLYWVHLGTSGYTCVHQGAHGSPYSLILRASLQELLHCDLPIFVKVQPLMIKIIFTMIFT